MISGVFTLPLFGTDTAYGLDGRHVGAGSSGFIAGPENVLLRVLIQAAAADKPPYNPMTLCGPTGVGKTHLLQGVVNHVRTLFPERKCWYLTGADFARQYVRSVELDTLSELRDKLAATRFLLIDGLDELATKPAVHHELVQVIDRCCERESQLLFSCQAPLSQWEWMQGSLRSRLSGGLIVPVALPGSAAREEIVQRLGIELGVSQADLLARVCSRSPEPETYRELKHATLQLVAEPASESAKSSESPTRIDPTSVNATARRIAKVVARRFEIKYSELVGPSRRKTVAQARGVAIFLARSYLNVSFEQLGRCFGNRDHTTILHAYRKTAQSLETDVILKQLVDRLREDLTVQVNL